jgi:hypothetical protein
VYPIVVLLLDGLADRAHDVLKGRTANEAARTPNLDRLAARGSCGVIYGVGPGRAASSEIAHWSMLGYRPEEFPGRAVFEAYKEVSPEHVFAYAALRPANGATTPVAHRPPASERDADAETRRGVRRPRVDRPASSRTSGGEAVLRISGDADDRVTMRSSRSPSRAAAGAVPQARGARRRE